MDLKDHLRVLAERIGKLKDNIKTEEATKNAFIMPFLQALGYDVFDPTEVVPEYVADIGTKKGEKVDYAIMKDDKPVILIECKHWAQKLEIHDNQLLRYFTTSKARFGILTNGIRYKFYTDLVESNVMDTTPFLEVDISDLKEAQIEEVKKFHKSYFDIANILNTASELKYVGEIKSILVNEFKTPSDDFVRFFAQKVFKGRVTEKVMAQFGEFVKKSVQGVLTDHIQDRLKSALDTEKASVQQPEAIVATPAEPVSLLVTTEDELEGFRIIKSILRIKVTTDRIFYRDTQSYFNILLDDTHRKTLCRLYFNNSARKQIAFMVDKKEVKHELANLDSIYDHSETLISILEAFLAKDK
jgi:predicted type IV restriction endonuclease